MISKTPAIEAKVRIKGELILSGVNVTYTVGCKGHNVGVDNFARNLAFPCFEFLSIENQVVS